MSLLRQLERLGTRLYLWPGKPAQPIDEVRFRARCEERFDVHARILTAAIIFTTVAFWPTDLWTLRRLPNASFFEWRTAAVVFSSLYLVLPRRLVGRHLVLLFTVLCSSVCFFAGHGFASIAGPESHFVHFCYLLPNVSIALPLALPQRIVVTTIFSSAAIAGVLLLFPEHRASPYTPMMLTHMTASVWLSVLFGQALLMLLRENFFQAQELARRTAALAAHSSLLEERVSEQTRELRQLIAHVETVQEVERTRLSRELHDSLGQELSALSYALTYTRKRFADEPTLIGPNLDELDDLLARTTTTTRAIMAELRPHILDDLGLTAATQWLVARIAARSALQCELRVSGDTSQLDPERRTAAFRILQEALTNVVRHANAQRAEVVIAIGEQALDLRIADDGIGINDAPRSQSALGGMGLISMRERASILGGKLAVKQREQGGTEVHCWLPLVERAAQL